MQVSVVHLVEEVNGGFLVLVSAVNQNIKVVACLGGNGDKLLISVEIIHQCCVALRGDRYALRLHAASGGFFLLWCLGGFRQRLRVGVSATGKSGGGKGRQAKHGGHIVIRQVNVVEVKGFLLRNHPLPFPAQGGQIPVHVKIVLLVGVGKVFIAGVTGNVVFLTEKRPDTAHLQNTLASVHRCDFVL